MDIKTNNLTVGAEALDGMLEGIEMVAQAIRPTYGHKGYNAVIENENYPYHEVANDAQTIIQALHTDKYLANRGLAFAKELSDKANKDSGDGRKTTFILTEEILKKARGYTKEELDAFIPLIEKEIDQQSTPITEKEVSKVATIAGESKELGDLIGEIYQKIGKDGNIILETSGLTNTYYDLIEGVRFIDTGYLTEAMTYDEQARKEGRKEMQAIYNNPTILVTKRKISHLNDINPLLATLDKAGKKDLVIFADDMDSGVASILVKAHKDRIINCTIIKAPILFKNYIYEDFAKVVGATIVEDATGIDFKNLELSHLGTCQKITIDKEETTILGGKDISEHVAQLTKEGSNDSLLRVTWLKNKTAIIYLGANNESELSYKRLKCTDALNSSRLALKGGVVKGGGECLVIVASHMCSKGKLGQTISDILFAPIEQICANAKIDMEERTIDADVLDATIVVKNAVRNAISLASTILTSGVVIVLPPKSQEQTVDQLLKSKGARF